MSIWMNKLNTDFECKMSIMIQKKTVIKNLVVPLIDELIQNPTISPSFKASWLGVKMFYGLLSDLHPIESKDFLLMIRKFVKEIGEELFDSSDFQQSLIVTFDSLLKTRNEKKRKLIRTIFLNGYISSENRELFEMERYYKVANEISIPAIEYLKFIYDVILPLKAKIEKIDMQKFRIEHQKDKERLVVQLFFKKKFDSEIIKQWIYEEYNPDSETMKIKFPDLSDNEEQKEKYSAEEKKKRDQYVEMASELTSLGIMRSGTVDGGLGYGTRGGENLTDFGKKFLEFIPMI